MMPVSVCFGIGGPDGIKDAGPGRHDTSPPVQITLDCDAAPASLHGAWDPARPQDLSQRPSAACHGQIYNLLELQQQLNLSADTPLSQVLLAAWQRWQADLLPRLDGDFAMVIQDGDQLLLYRSPSGFCNLYYRVAPNGQVAYAAHPRLLTDAAEGSQRLARRSLHEYLRFLDIAAPNTFFENIIAVEPGQAVRWSGRRPEVQSQARFRVRTRDDRHFDAAVETLDHHLHRSVETRLAGAARPAAFLSGGIDSALLTAIASRQRADLTAITVGFDGVAFDEAPIARQIARHLGVRHEVLRFSREDYLLAFERLAAGAEQPMADPATLATILAFDHCRTRHDLVLDGTGADEAVGMMPARHVRLAVGYASVAPHRVRRRLAQLLRGVPWLSDYAPIVDFEHPADTMIRWQGFSRSEIAALCDEPVSFEHTHFYETFRHYSRGAHFERFSALVEAMPCERLNQAMQITGLSVRFPFSDRQTDSFIRQLATDYRYRPGEPKRILRALLARYLPEAIWDVPKHGFNFPLQEFLAGDDFWLVRHHLDPQRWRETGLLAPEKVGQYAQQFMAGDQRLKFRVWALAILGAWLEKHPGLDGSRTQATDRAMLPQQPAAGA